MSSRVEGDGSPSQTLQGLTPPFPAVQAEFSELADKEIELTDFSGDGEQIQRRRHDEEIHDLRIAHSRLLLGLALVWALVILAVVLLQGFGQWFTPLSVGLIHLSFELSDAVVIAFITSTTATVIGLYAIAAYWLYGRSKRSEVTADKRMKA